MTAYVCSCFSKLHYSGPSGNPSGNLPDASGMRLLSYRITGWITDRITELLITDYGPDYGLGLRVYLQPYLRRRI